MPLVFQKKTTKDQAVVPNSFLSNMNFMLKNRTLGSTDHIMETWQGFFGHGFLGGVFLLKQDFKVLVWIICQYQPPKILMSFAEPCTAGLANIMFLAWQTKRKNFKKKPFKSKLQKTCGTVHMVPHLRLASLVQLHLEQNFLSNLGWSKFGGNELY